MASGYSANPLYKKLGLKDGFHVKLIHEPDHYPQLISGIFDHLKMDRSNKEIDFIHFFPGTTGELEKLLPRLKTEIKKNGMIWVSWYKNSSGKKSELTEDIIRNTALAIGLVDVKVCAVDEFWSGLKLVIPLKDR